MVKKSEWVFDEKKEKKWRRKSPQTKNELYREMLGACAKNRIEFGYVLSDVWYSSSENMGYIKEELEKEFIMPLKSNRKEVARRLPRSKSGESTSKLGRWNWNRTRWLKSTWSRWSSRCF